MILCFLLQVLTGHLFLLNQNAQQISWQVYLAKKVFQQPLFMGKESSLQSGCCPTSFVLRWLEIVFEIFFTRKRFTFIYIITAFIVAT